jgi:hypothetical protein
LIRFNTKFENDDQKRYWRVLVDGEERLAHRVDIYVHATTITESIASGEIKHHFLCEGHVLWKEGDVAVVLSQGEYELLVG